VSALKLSFILPVGIIVLATAAAGLGLSMFAPVNNLKHQLTIQKSESKSANIQSQGKETTAPTQTLPAKNLMAEVPKVFQGTTIYQAKLQSNEKVIALTFDDGPSPKNTAQVLEILKKNNIKATFFMIGQMVKEYPKVAKQVVDEGHVLGNHTWHHWYRKMDSTTAASEINRTADIIYQTTGAKTALFRPPGGYLNNGLATYAKQQKQAVMMWSITSGDADRHPPQASGLVANVLKGAKPGTIVLMHDGGGNRARTVAALPQIISGLRVKGYKFVTVPELLEMQAKEPQLATVISPAVKPTTKPVVKNQEGSTTKTKTQ
jgi:peptidoglycan-N-acetylglucosamine deacetylase